MNNKNNIKLLDSSDISPLAHDLSYGEQKHRQFFGFGINFLTNLLTSAGFTYWVNHSQSPLQLFGRQFERPAEVQRTVAKWIEAKPFMKVFSEGGARFEAAKVMAGVLTLTAAGHLIMIPSVWLGAKIKPWFVEKANRRHYGDEAMEDPSLKARHLAIRMEDRPTLFGAVTGRFGTILATQFTGYTIGSNRNLVRWAGTKLNSEALQNFKGIDYITEFAGDKFGGILSEALPKQTERLNASMAKRNFGWSLNQIDHNTALKGEAYGHLPRNGGTSGFNEHYGKYVVSDIMYTMVTALTINPAINFFKKFIPGMTYKPQVTQEVPEYLRDDIAKIRVRPNPVVAMDATAPNDAERSANDNANDADSTPRPRIDLSRTAHLSTVAPALRHEVGA